MTGSTLRARSIHPVVLLAGVLLAAALMLHAFGQPWWCKCGSWSPWAWQIRSSHNSQHLIDWYSPSHLLHGLCFYALFALAPLGLRARFALAMMLETGWELLENSRLIIERYRSVTASLDYFGDSVLNSLSDISCCALGFWIASKVPARVSIALFLFFEAFTTLLVRDGLLLNIFMLIAPNDAVREWQMAAR